MNGIRLDWRRTALWASVVVGVLALSGSALGLEIRGQVVDPEGNPAEGASVRLVPMVGSEGIARLLWQGESLPPSVAEAIVGSDGWYRFDADEGMYRVLVDLEGAVAQQRNVLPLLDDLVLPPCELTESREVELRVKLSDGSPARGAWVATSFPGYVGWLTRNLFVRVDAAGLASVPVPPEGASRLSIVHPAGLEFSAEDVLPGQRTVRLEEGVPRRVRVVDARGKPVQSAGVTVGRAWLPVAVTDASGHATVRAPANQGREGRGLRVGVLTLGGASLRTTISAPPEEEPEAVHDLVLDAGRRISGSVVETGSGEPIPGAWVWLTSHPHRHERTTADGMFSLDGMPVRPSWVQAAAPGYRSEWVRVEEGEDGPPGIEVALDKVVGLPLRVVDPEGNPLEGVAIGVEASPGAQHQGWTHGPEAPVAISDASGHARLGPLPEDADFLLVAQRGDLAPTRQQVVLPLPEIDLPLRVVVSRGHTLVLYVEGEDGNPIEGAVATLEDSAPSSVVHWGGEDPGLVQAASVAEGTVRIPHCAAGRYRLRLRRPGSAPRVLRGIGVPTGEGEIDLGTLTLGPEATIAGRVEDREGRRLSDVGIYVVQAPNRIPGPSAEPSARTGRDGAFVVREQTPDQAVTLQARKEGWKDGPFHDLVPPLDEDLVLVLDRSSRIEGRVVDVNGTTLPNARIGLTIGRSHGGSTSSQSQMPSEIGPTGQFSFEISAQEASLEVEAPGFRSRSVELDLRPGEVRTGVEVVLEPGVRMTGRVVDARGTPVGGARLHLESGVSAFPRGMRGPSGITGQDGEFALDGLAPGRAALVVFMIGRPEVVEVVEVGPAGADVEVVVPSGVRISGQVVDPAGRPAPGVDIVIEQERAVSRLESRTSAEGAFELEGLSAGAWRLTASSASLGTGSLDVDVGSQDLSGLVVDLQPGGVLRGRILGATSEELAEAMIRAQRWFGPSLDLDGVVDLDGRWKIDDVPPGSWSVYLGIAERGHQADLDLGPGGEAVHDFDVTGGVRVSGLVLHRGEPVAGAEVYVNSARVLQASVTTDSTGRFEVLRIEPGSLGLTIAHEAQGLRGRRKIEVGTADIDLTIELDAQGAAGRVVDAVTGEGLAGARVTWRAETLWGSGLTEADGQGYFQTGGTPSGRVWLSAQVEGFGLLQKEVMVPEGGRVEDVVFALEPSRGLVLRFLPPIPRHIFVSQIGPVGSRGFGEHFERPAGDLVRLDEVPTGPLDLEVRADGHVTSRLTVEVPTEAPVPVQMPLASTLHLEIPHLFGTDGHALAEIRGVDGATFRSSQSSWAEGDRVNVFGGRVAVRDLPPGTWTVVVTGPDGQTWQGSVTTTVGRPTLLRLSHPSGAE